MEYKQLPGFSKYKFFEDGSVQGLRGFNLKLNNHSRYSRLGFKSDEGQITWYTIHRIMAYLYHGLALDNYDLEPDHKDNNKLNNHKDNLEIVTRSENQRRKCGREPNSNIDTSTHKQCSKCLGLKSRAEFKPKNQSVDGLGSWCRDCTNAYKRAYSRRRGWTKT